MENRKAFQFPSVECPERSPRARRGGEVEGQALVYILECSNGSLYVGSSTNIQQRLKDHMAGTAALWTKRLSPFQLVYFKDYPSHLEAARREQQVKRWSRIKKMKLITGAWQ
jgi:putative endonuclease